MKYIYDPKELKIKFKKYLDLRAKMINKKLIISITIFSVLLFFTSIIKIKLE